MGIKGIYKEIGPGRRISLTKLAVDSLEQSGRPFRLAIDISIWQFQAQAARGGANPAIRTLFYRLLRLLSLSIQPIFVFDGPNKPTFKRNKRTSRGDGVATSMAKRLIRLFGFRVHDAPGEAEAECALLQQTGIVDAVLSEDVDTIMFGCTRSLRNWSAEGTKGSKTPTHVSMYDAKELREGGTGLSREGMVLVALMSGGDYLPEGIPGAGVKLACEAAKAGFGDRLCRLKRAETSELSSWKEWLIYELRTNESGFFRTRHKVLNVPEDFPNLEILRYYTHPVVSPASTLEQLRHEQWGRPLDILGLREFVRETFDWNYRGGAIKFIRVLAPGLLVRKLMDCDPLLRGTGSSTQSDPSSEKETGPDLIRAISSRRAHFSTDATSELRLSFIPTSVVGYNFEEEPEEVIASGRDGLALNSDEELEAADDDGAAAEIGSKNGPKKQFSPTEPDLCWIPEAIAQIGVREMVIDWDEAQKAKVAKKTQPKKTRTTKASTKQGGMAAGAMDRFVRVTKQNTLDREAESLIATKASLREDTPLRSSSSLPRARSPPASSSMPPQSMPSPLSPVVPPPTARATRPSKQTKSASSRNQPATSKPASYTNPWTIAGSQINPRITKPPAKPQAIIIPSSPPASPPSDLHSIVKTAKPKDADHPSSSVPSSPQKRRSTTPPSQLKTDSPVALWSAREGSPTRPPDARPRRKLARTESLPVDAVSHGPASSNGRGQPRTLQRSRTVAAAPILSDSDDDDDDDGDEGDPDLPPVASLFNRLPNAADPSPNNLRKGAPFEIAKPPLPSSTQSTNWPTKNRGGLKHHHQQTTLLDVFGSSNEGSGGSRMTKMYVPSKGAAGFFREVDVTVDEAEAIKRREEYSSRGLGKPKGSSVFSMARAVRRSDISVVDLTGDD